MKTTLETPLRSTDTHHPQAVALDQEPSCLLPSQGNRLLVPIFMTTIFLSSVLVFSVQPLFAKMVLPLLGGSPGVWNTAMLFFQIVLLAGYGYAHLTTKLFSLKWQIGLHITLLVVVLPLLPIGIATGWTPPVEEPPVSWLIGLFAVSVGLPFFAVATNAPLLQRWFSHTNHRHASDPYFLYAASNLGSILALLSYPLLFEPLFSSHEQSVGWGWGYALLLALLLLCSMTMWQRNSTTAPPLPVQTATQSEEVPTLSRRLHWLALAFVPSSLLLGVTLHITTDVAAVPLLWVLPLTIYLLTFVFVFARRPWLPHAWMVLAQPFFIIPIGVQRFGGILLDILLPMAVFFVTTMVCHGELAKRRPDANHLTEFYLCLSLGGMFGGAFNVLIAPLLFNSVMEYPLMLVLACCLRPRQKANSKWVTPADLLWPILLFAVLGGPIYLGEHPNNWGMIGVLIFYLVLGLSIYSFRHRPIRFGLGVAAALILTTLLGTQKYHVNPREKFFWSEYSTTKRNRGLPSACARPNHSRCAAYRSNTLEGTTNLLSSQWTTWTTLFYI